jgi:threonine-phosphate decarboxylase
MELFNGGSSAIFALFRHLSRSLSHCTIYSPAYLEYKKAAHCFGYGTTHIDRLTQMDETVREGSLVVFVNPSTPDGHFYEMEPFLQMWQRQGCTVLVDESFIEFTPYASVSELLAAYPNLYILKSMTKFFGAAGIRVGTLISHTRNIEALKTTEPLWKLSAFDSAYIAAALKDRDFKARSDTANAQSREYLLDILAQSPLVRHIYPSVANYVLVELEGITAGQLQQKLLPHRVMVRNCENFDTLGASHVRIAVKNMDDLTRFREALNA